MTVVFVGHFSPLDATLDEAASPAGNQVQRQIFKELGALTGEETYCYSMQPAPSWPRGRLIQRSRKEGRIQFIGYLNLPAIKHFIFALRLFFNLMQRPPRICMQYNSYLFENVSCLAYRLARRCPIIIFIQDIQAPAGNTFLSKSWFKRTVELTALHLAKLYNLIVPISAQIIADFHFPPHKCYVFQGGITAYAEALMSDPRQELEPIAVFAGALEPYNGIDRLVDKWLSSEIEHKLHIFGRGSLEKQISNAAEQHASIVYHGFQCEDVVIGWQRVALWNFCLRYSLGINQKYFFPSKFFNLLCSPGTVIANDFSELPTNLRNYIVLLRDDLGDLKEQLQEARSRASAEIIRERRELAISAHSWRSCVRQVIGKFSRHRDPT